MSSLSRGANQDIEELPAKRDRAFAVRDRIIEGLHHPAMTA